MKITIKVKDIPLYIALGVSVISTLGSLYFSEISGFVPCTLCWYQRVCMYPLIVILGIGIYEKKENIYKYVLPFSILGLCVSVYHNLIQYGVIPEDGLVCNIIGSCTQRYVNLYGFITIPLLALIAFILINVCLLVYVIKQNKNIQ